jgi:MFS family permease
MSHHQHELSGTVTVIQFHVLGMFLPSFFTGSLIQRFGVLRVMLTGIAILVGYVLMAGYGTEFLAFASALTLLGVGWNFLYVGGTTLLTSTYTAAEKGTAQATNDMTIFVVGLLCSFGAGWLHQLLGWQQLNLFLLPWLAVAALLILVFGAKRRRVGDSSLPVAENPNLPRPISAR